MIGKNPAYLEHPAYTGNVAPAQPQGGGLAGLFSDPNFQSFLAGTGARLDPEGVGGALGGATQEAIQQQQMGKAMEKQGDLMDRLLEAMAGGKIGGASVKPDGSVSLKASDNVSTAQSSQSPPQFISPQLQQMMTDIFARYQSVLK